ncbi:hypothetical protein P7C70_g5323, partial [Phenoliferia sp. Uapishka_3]
MAKTSAVAASDRVPARKGIGKNGVVGEINTILKKLYPVDYTQHQHGTLFSSMGFAGTVVGMLVFGYLADKIGRKFGMITATLIVAVFTLLAASAYGAGGSVPGMLQALIAYRFLTGIGIGADSSTIVNSDLKTVFGWNVVINLFYIPGTMLGALVVDKVKPKRLMISMLLTQAVIGFIMSGLYVQLTGHIGAFAVVYGLFLSFGEAGPGNCLGLLASKSWPTAVRGQMYGLAAAIGKIGAFCGTWAFPAIIDAFPVGPKQDSGPFWIGSGLAVLSAIIVFFMITEIPEDHMTNEDAAFRQYLEANNYDTSAMGLRPEQMKDELEAQRESSIEEKEDVKADA